MNEKFLIEKFGKKPKLKNPILIEGLPGVGNVARIACDYLIERLNAKKYCNLYTYFYPNTVFITEDHLIDLPKIEFYYYKNKKGRDIIFVVGDAQPARETENYIFCEKILGIAKSLGVKEVITLGGIASGKIPPNVYVAATNKKYIKELKKHGVNTKQQGAVVIVGAAGILLGLSKFMNMGGFALLADSHADPATLGFKAAKEIIKVLNSYLKIKVPLKELEVEIKEQRKELKTLQNKLLRKLRITKQPSVESLSYIG